ncbi:MAG: helix-turn-helix transcriptional regulator [Bacteroidetes bacterium]|nr:helix-turn-helix transcriptional regulator [Bacteroidota bacterium]
MNQSISIQETLFHAIKGKLPPNVSFVHSVSELLGISYDSVYRRVRGEKELTLEELKTICEAYDISVDTLFSLQSRHISFNSLAIGEEGFSIENWLQTLLVEIKKIHPCKQQEIIYAAKDIPLFYYFEFPEIAAFKFFFWQQVLIPSAGSMYQKLTLDVPETLYKTGRQLLSYYVRVPVIEIWSEETISSVLRQIEYCFVAGFFTRNEDVFRLIDVLETWLGHVQAQAEHGFQFMLGTTPEGVENSYKLFHNEVLVNDNTILVTMDDRKVCYNTYNVINQLITTSPVFCDQIDKSLRNLMQKSTMISGTSSKERYRFFNALHEKVRLLRCRIEKMI